jgi:hypothetical protein
MRQKPFFLTCDYLAFSWILSNINRYPQRKGSDPLEITNSPSIAQICSWLKADIEKKGLQGLAALKECHGSKCFETIIFDTRCKKIVPTSLSVMIFLDQNIHPSKSVDNLVRPWSV